MIHYYDPHDPADIASVLGKYNVRLYQSEEQDIPVWAADYDDGEGKGGTSTFFYPEDETDEERSRKAAALLCYLWYEKGVHYPLCRDLARQYFPRWDS